MPKVTYRGAGLMTHSSNPTGTEYRFYNEIPVEVKAEDAVFYAKKQERGSPFEVDMGIVETVKATAEKVTDAIKSQSRRGGKK